MDKKIIYPELSYQIVGIAYKVFNELGFGLSEKYYQRTFALELSNNKLIFEKEKLVNLKYQNQSLGNCFLDFYIDKKIIVELKVKPRLGYVHIKQVMNYLKAINSKLAILIYFTKEGVKYRRIINNK